MACHGIKERVRLKHRRIHFPEARDIIMFWKNYLVLDLNRELDTAIYFAQYVNLALFVAKGWGKDRENINKQRKRIEKSHAWWGHGMKKK